MKELSERSGVPVPTVKFYLREGLLPPGEAAGATRAHYGEEHVRRLRLVRALVDVAGMGLDRVREVLDAVDAGGTLEASVGGAHLRLSPEGEPTARSRARSAELVAALGWACDPEESHTRALAVALDAMDAAGQPMTEETLRVYAGAAGEVATSDYAGMPADDATDAATFAILGTVLSEPVLLSLRRMAHESIARGGVPGPG